MQLFVLVIKQTDDYNTFFIVMQQKVAYLGKSLLIMLDRMVGISYFEPLEFAPMT